MKKNYIFFCILKTESLDFYNIKKMAQEAKLLITNAVI